MKNIWSNCMNCAVNCCRRKEISYTLFLTKEEAKKFIDINKAFPCKYLNKNGLCEIHSQRPIDCRLFPFEIVKEGGTFFWAYWETNCPITKKGSKKQLESCLRDLEMTIIPRFVHYMDGYSQFRYAEFVESFGRYIKLRKINY